MAELDSRPPANEFELDGVKYLLKKYNRFIAKKFVDKYGAEKMRKIIGGQLDGIPSEEADNIYLEVGYELLPDEGKQTYPTLDALMGNLNEIDTINLGLATGAAMGWATKPAYMLSEMLRLQEKINKNPEKKNIELSPNEKK